MIITNHKEEYLADKITKEEILDAICIGVTKFKDYMETDESDYIQLDPEDFIQKSIIDYLTSKGLSVD